MIYRQIICLLAIVSYASAFLTGCQQFNPLNFNQCLKCSQNFYLSNSSCVICPSSSNITGCQKTQRNETAQLQVQNTSTRQIPAANGTNTTLPSSNSIQINQTNTTAIQVKSNNDSLRSTNEANQTKDSRNQSNQVTNSSNQTSTLNNTADNKSKGAPDLVSQLTLILGLLPENCVSFGIKNNKIACTQCHPEYQLNNQSICIKAAQSNNQTGNSTILSTNNRTNNTIQVSEINGLNSQSNLSLPNINSTSPPNPDNLSQSQNISRTQQQVPSQTKQQVPPQFIPPLPQIQQTPQMQPTQQTPQTQPAQQTPQMQPAQQTLQTQPIQQTATQIKPQTISQSQPQQAVYPSLKTIIDLNCMDHNPNFSLKRPISSQNVRCRACYPSFYYNMKEEICLPKNPLCRQCDDLNRCLSCFPGYILIGSQCQINQGQVPLIVGMPSIQSQGHASASQLSSVDPNCQRYSPATGQCLLCAGRFYLDSTGICTQIDPSCKTWQPNTGICQSCYTGYVPSEANPKICVAVSKDTASQAGDPNNFRAYCVRRVSNVCVQCLNRYFLLNGLCFPVSDLCRTYNQGFGFCESCYAGYVLNSGVCQMQIAASARDPFCLAWSNSRCTNCMLGYFWSQQEAKCSVVSILCNGYNSQNGHCTGCYAPYSLDRQSGTCFFRN